MKKLSALLLALMMVLSMAACGASSKDADRYEAMAEPENGIQQNASEEAAPETPNVLPENRKLIRTVYLDAETKDMETLVSQVCSQVTELGGYIQSKEQYHGSEYDSYRSADLTIRVPAEKADELIGKVDSAANLISTSENLEDVTLDYVATESRMKALQTEEARLLEMMESAEDMSDLLAIEERLTDVRSELETITSQMRTYDNLIDYTTIYLHVSQVQELTEAEPETFWQRVKSGFADNLSGLGEGIVDFTVWLIVSLPYLVPVILIIVLIVVLVKRRKNKKKKKAAEKEQKQQ